MMGIVPRVIASASVGSSGWVPIGLRVVWLELQRSGWVRCELFLALDRLVQGSPGLSEIVNCARSLILHVIYGKDEGCALYC